MSCGLNRVSRLCFGRRRQGDGEAGAAARVDEFDLAAMRLDDRAAEREADAETARFGGEKALEQAGDMVGGDARTAILDFDPDPAAFRLQGAQREPRLRGSRLRHRL